MYRNRFYCSKRSTWKYQRIATIVLAFAVSGALVKMTSWLVDISEANENSRVETVLPSGDMVCKRYETGFVKCEDSIAVCYYDRYHKDNMVCLKKEKDCDQVRNP